MSYPPPTARPPKSVGVAYALLICCLGIFGVHQFYLGKVGRGIGYIFTAGWLFIGPIIDLFTLPAQVRLVNLQRAGFGTGAGVNVNVSNNQGVAQIQQAPGQHRGTELES